ncbi:hypothetical protein LSTR_LSTR016565 [Laodelphax striatellus]|uniref:Uncharacterized protein n=1 Tax=Laodelphax striatellus TaxID=195883 RepID=A0A482X093_LAOST|nr:hypothetical protein LSTR_LSTR016565 [Laodelphax striatellus]
MHAAPRPPPSFNVTSETPTTACVFRVLAAGRRIQKEEHYSKISNYVVLMSKGVQLDFDAVKRISVMAPPLVLDSLDAGTHTFAVQMFTTDGFSSSVSESVSFEAEEGMLTTRLFVIG